MSSDNKTLGEAIYKKFKDEMKKIYGNKQVWVLIEPDEKVTANPEEKLSNFERTEIEKLFRTTVMNPRKYPFMNEWATLSMDILNRMSNHGMYPDNSALHIAVKQGFPSIINKLLQFPNIDINSKGYDGRTPLHECLISQNTNMKILCDLISAGADFSAQDNKGETPLNIVILFWNKKGQEWLPLMIMDYLNDYDYTKKNKRGENILEYATIMNAQPSVIKKIQSLMPQ